MDWTTEESIFLYSKSDSGIVDIQRENRRDGISPELPPEDGQKHSILRER